MKSVLPAAALLLAMGVASHAQIAASIEQPQCYEGVGCPHRDRITAAQIRDFPCDFLWLVRNTIFHQRGYCFRSVRGMKEFSNRNCKANSIEQLVLSDVERANVAILQAAESARGCK